MDVPQLELAVYLSRFVGGLTVETGNRTVAGMAGGSQTMYSATPSCTASNQREEEGILVCQN